VIGFGLWIGVGLLAGQVYYVRHYMQIGCPGHSVSLSSVLFQRAKRPELEIDH
jgi:hypothetical protein